MVAQPHTPDPPTSFRYTRTHRLSGSRQFQAVFDAKMRKSAGPLAVLARPNGLSHHRLGMSVSRKVGNAVRRHRIKRRLREAFRLHQHAWPGAYDLVVIVYPHEALPMMDYAGLVGPAVEQLHHVAEKRRLKQESQGPS